MNEEKEGQKKQGTTTVQAATEGKGTPVIAEENTPEPSKALAGAEKDLATPKSEEDAKRLGVKDVAQNADAMAIAKKAEEDKNEEQPPAAPSFFIDEEKHHRIEVDILCSRKDGQVLSVSRVGLGIDYDEFQYLTHVKEWFEFTIPTYEDMSSYRQRCGIYRAEAQQVLIDRLQLRNFMLVWHLKDWSLRTPDGKKVELVHDQNGSLGDESMKMVYKTHTTILDVVLTILEKDVLLS
jgi:hypothetical protein